MNLSLSALYFITLFTFSISFHRRLYQPVTRRVAIFSFQNYHSDNVKPQLKSKLKSFLQEFVLKFSIIRSELILKVKPDEVSRRWLRDSFDKRGVLGYNTFLGEVYKTDSKRISLKFKDEATSLEYDVGKVVDIEGISTILSDSKDILCQGNSDICSLRVSRVRYLVAPFLCLCRSYKGQKNINRGKF